MSVPYPNYPPQNVIFVSAHRRARLVMGLMVAFIVANIIMLGYEVIEINHYSRIVAGEVVTEDEEFFNALGAIGAGLLYLLVYIPTAVLFLMWIHRAYKNLPALGAQKLEYSPGWAVGYFFIPFLNLYFPYRITREIWKKSDPEIQDPDHYLAEPKSTPALLPLWWVAWIVSGVLDRIVFRLSISEEDPAQLLFVTKLSMFSGVVNIIASVLALLVVQEIDLRQEARAARFLLPHTPPPPPVFDQSGASILRPPA